MPKGQLGLTSFAATSGSDTTTTTEEQSWGGTLNVDVAGMLVGNFLENPKNYPGFDFKPLKNTEIAVLRAILGKMASIFQKFSRRP